MRTSTKFLISLGFAFLALAWWLSYSAAQKRHEFKPTLLSQSITVKRGLVLEASFQSDIDERYDINLDVERKLPMETVNCLLGIAWHPENKCSESDNVVSMEWEVQSEKQIVAKGESRPKSGGYWSTTIGRRIGQFQAKAGTNYLLQVKSAMNGGELNSANPKILVTVNAARGKREFVGSAFTGAASIVLACAGGAMLLMIAVVALFRKIRPEDYAE